MASRSALRNHRLGFLDLPYDTRFLIYQYLANFEYSAGQNAHPILSTCRSIYREASDLLYSNALFDISITDQSIAMRGVKRVKFNKPAISHYFGRLKRIRIWIDLRLDVIQSAMDAYGEYLDHYIRHIDENPDFVDEEPSPDLYETEERYRVEQARNSARRRLLRVCSTLSKRNNRLQTLTVIVKHKNPECLLDKGYLLNPLTMLSNIPNVHISFPGENFSHLEKAMQGPLPGFSAVSS
jgi:hypothetical protein